MEWRRFVTYLSNDPRSIQTRWHKLFQPASMDAFELEYDFVHVIGVNNWSYKTCTAPVKMFPSTNQHPVLLQAGCPSYWPNNSVKALKGEHSSKVFDVKAIPQQRNIYTNGDKTLGIITLRKNKNKPFTPAMVSVEEWIKLLIDWSFLLILFIGIWIMSCQKVQSVCQWQSCRKQSQLSQMQWRFADNIAAAVVRWHSDRVPDFWPIVCGFESQPPRC